jgi:hypothetical protein
MAEGEVKLIDTQSGAPQSSGASTSLFNAFYVFKYSGGVEKISESNYTTNRENERHGAKPVVISNPTASAIIDWAKKLPESTSNLYGLKNSPYTWSDFLFCKWYGIIPNNRLVTLRKFPLGANDEASVNRTDSPQNIPVAQAVTWFGGTTGNDLNSMWQNAWSLAWKEGSTTAKDTQGKEIVNFTQSLVEALPKGTNEFVVKAIQNMAALQDAKSASSNSTISTQTKEYLASIGKGELEIKKQEFLKTMYSDTGALFNQIQGPVNVKNTFLYRDRGLSGSAINDKWAITFDYRTDSYFGMNQRRVGLDIIANMLELTYSNGEWLESLNIFYKNVGLGLTAGEEQLIESSFRDGVLDAEQLAEAFATIAATRAEGLLNTAIDLAKESAGVAASAVGTAAKSLFGGGTFDLSAAIDPAKIPTLRSAIEIELTKALAKSFPGFVQQRANVAGIPTGNWHLTVGNPMNPIMRIGDLVVRDCTMTFGEELGPDDFPIEMKFVITLSPTKPRNSGDIRRTFNTGRADYAIPYGGHTFDQANTYGVVNKRFLEESSGKGGAGNQPKGSNTAVSGTLKENAKTWITDRYGAKMVNDKFFDSVYFYQANKKDETQGGSGTPTQTTPTPPAK